MDDDNLGCKGTPGHLTFNLVGLKRCYMESLMHQYMATDEIRTNYLAWKMQLHSYIEVDV